MYVSTRRDSAAARCLFTRALATTKVVPVEVTTDKAAVYPHVLDELVSSAGHWTQAYANNRMQADHGQLKAAPATDAWPENGSVSQDCRE